MAKESLRVKQLEQRVREMSMERNKLLASIEREDKAARSTHQQENKV